MTEEPEQKNQPRRTRTILLAVVGLVIGIGLGWILLTRFLPPNYNGMIVNSDAPVTNFKLTGPGGQPVNLVDYRGKVVLLYYGYTFCPDVCPATLSELKKTVAELGNKADNVQVFMISLDPERDTPEALAEYMAHFHPSFIGLTGTEDEIVAASAPLGIFYERHEGTPATGYLIDHTATVMALDKNGRLRLLYSFDTPGEDIATDLRYLIRD
ncbi:MAG: redoxin domain-containing protein [Chloroflexi bacterium]|nr:redoxin domain-containing protein [Chloroflexota bacterium]